MQIKMWMVSSFFLTFAMCNQFIDNNKLKQTFAYSLFKVLKKKKRLCKPFMRKEMHSTNLLNLKYIQNTHGIVKLTFFYIKTLQGTFKAHNEAKNSDLLW